MNKIKQQSKIFIKMKYFDKLYDIKMSKKQCSTKYEEQNNGKEFIFQEARMRSLCSNVQQYLGGYNFFPNYGKYFMKKYIYDHPNCNFIIENCNNLYFFIADLRDDECAKANELTWQKFLGEEIIQEWIETSKIHKNGTGFGLQTDKIPLGYILISKFPDEECDNSYCIELMDTFYCKGNISQLMINLLSKKLKTRVLIPRETDYNDSYWEKMEEKYNFIAKQLMDDYYIIEQVLPSKNCDTLNLFKKKNFIKWSDKLTDSIKTYIFEYIN